jgi:hypothetical protein
MRSLADDIFDLQVRRFEYPDTEPAGSRLLDSSANSMHLSVVSWGILCMGFDLNDPNPPKIMTLADISSDLKHFLKEAQWSLPIVLDYWAIDGNMSCRKCMYLAARQQLKQPLPFGDTEIAAGGNSIALNDISLEMIQDEYQRIQVWYAHFLRREEDNATRDKAKLKLDEIVKNLVAQKATQGWDAINPTTNVGIPNRDELLWIQYPPHGRAIQRFSPQTAIFGSLPAGQRQQRSTGISGHSSLHRAIPPRAGSRERSLCPAPEQAPLATALGVVLPLGLHHADYALGAVDVYHLEPNDRRLSAVHRSDIILSSGFLVAPR